MMKPEIIIAMLLLEKIDKEDVNVKTLSNSIALLKKRGLDVSNISLRNVPGGYYSDEVESFIGRLLLFNYAQQRSPIKLSSEGKELCNNISEKAKTEHPYEVDKINQLIKTSEI
ncbi:MAG: hypothetical protein AB1641_25575 [Thermodesulfobacteriota bacterium]